MVGRDRVLVAYGSKHGATGEIAEVIGMTLRVAGLEVEVQRARQVRSLDSYRAVVLGSAVYFARWRREAMRLLRRPELRRRDVWLFSSGPVGEESGDRCEIERQAKPKRVEKIADSLGVHEHAVFGGLVADDAGLMRRRMASKIAPELRDRRDWGAIEAWARSIAAALSGRPVTASS